MMMARDPAKGNARPPEPCFVCSNALFCRAMTGRFLGREFRYRAAGSSEQVNASPDAEPAGESGRKWRPLGRL